jgi:hypothetical protein
MGMHGSRASSQAPRVVLGPEDCATIMATTLSARYGETVARAAGAEGTLTGWAARAGASAQRYAHAVDAREQREFPSKTGAEQRGEESVRAWGYLSEVSDTRPRC